jgi:bifunctional DNA-binding transcriptional regulator/antitoxin component of YhaV-PrlF toxin-antitoxin module
MSTTITMSEAGLVQLPEAVRRLLRLEGAVALDLDVENDSIRLRPRQPAAEPARLVRNKRGRLVIADGPVLTDDVIVEAIKAGRDERA